MRRLFREMQGRRVYGHNFVVCVYIKLTTRLKLSKKLQIMYFQKHVL